MDGSSTRIVGVTRARHSDSGDLMRVEGDWMGGMEDELCCDDCTAACCFRSPSSPHLLYLTSPSFQANSKSYHKRRTTRYNHNVAFCDNPVGWEDPEYTRQHELWLLLNRCYARYREHVYIFVWLRMGAACCTLCTYVFLCMIHLCAPFFSCMIGIMQFRINLHYELQ